MADDVWYYMDGERQVGPVSEADIRALIGSGKVTANTLVWTASMEDWTEARNVPELAAAAGVVPLPANGSSTNSPSLLVERMIRPSNCSGIWQPCQPARSLNVPHTRGKNQVSSSGWKLWAISCGRRIQVSSGNRPLGFARRSP